MEVRLDSNGVPFFLIDQKYGVSGAQSSEAFAGAFEQVLEFRASADGPGTGVGTNAGVDTSTGAAEAPENHHADQA